MSQQDSPLSDSLYTGPLSYQRWRDPYKVLRNFKLMTEYVGMLAGTEVSQGSN